MDENKIYTIVPDNGGNGFDVVNGNDICVAWFRYEADARTYVILKTGNPSYI